MEETIVVNNISKKFGNFFALKDLSIEITRGEKVAIFGKSGSGKSTLLYLLGGLDRPTSGDIFCFGENISKLTDIELARYRNIKVGFIFQFHFLLGTLTGLENILLPARINGDVSLKEIKQNSIKYAHRLGVSDILHKLPSEMSGGQQQRINILRAISLKPRLLLCDEPTGNLDSENSKIVIELLDEIALDSGATLMVVTHDQGVASRFPRQIEILDGGLGIQPMNSL
tara:strand:+ start:160 stop:843 length:684 start_codon:yes stop_codon:yes gene_type:complete